MFHHGAVEDRLGSLLADFGFGIVGDHDRLRRRKLGELMGRQFRSELGDFGGTDHLVEEHFVQDRVVFRLDRALVPEERGEEASADRTRRSEDGANDGGATVRALNVPSQYAVTLYVGPPHRNSQGMHALFLGQFGYVTQLVILAAGLGEPPAVVKHASLAQFEGDLGLEVLGAVSDERSAVEVGVGRGGIFLLEEKPDDPDVDAQLVLVRAAVEIKAGVSSESLAKKIRDCLLTDCQIPRGCRSIREQPRGIPHPARAGLHIAPAEYRSVRTLMSVNIGAAFRFRERRLPAGHDQE